MLNLKRTPRIPDAVADRRSALSEILDSLRLSAKMLPLSVHQRFQNNRAGVAYVCTLRVD